MTVRIERAAVTVALVALALWVGGLFALGAIAAPAVFGLVPAPLSGDAMGTAFRRFDAVAMTCAVVVLAVEALRQRAGSDHHSRASRWRVVAAVGASASAIAIGAWVSPEIMRLHGLGAVRGFGDAGLALHRLHEVAERLGKLEVTLGLALIVLHAVTMPAPAEGRR